VQTTQASGDAVEIVDDLVVGHRRLEEEPQRAREWTVRATEQQRREHVFAPVSVHGHDDLDVV